MPRSALIVDDSRTALAALSRMLQAQEIHVDTVESGPEALNHLRSNADPGVIFLDHMMPGMDGFETLTALKTDARTAAIPVVMYTTKEGDAYMGQAISQGAIGVLHKPINPAELSMILQRIDRLRVPSAVINTPSAGQRRTAVTNVIDVPGEFRTAAPGTTSSNDSSQTTVTNGPASTYVHPTRFTRIRQRAGLALLGIVLLLPAAWYYQRSEESDRQRLQLRAELEQLRNEQQTQAEARAIQAEAESSARTDGQHRKALLEALAWALNLRGQYRFNEEPLNDARASQLRDLVARLGAAGFQGGVRLETHVGEFCVMRDDQGTYRLPGDNVPFSRCEVLHYPPAQAEYLGRRQSPAFARFLAQQGDGVVRITVVSYGSSRPLVPYPELSNVQSASEWNQIARLNQRVEIVLVPAP